MDMDYVRRSGQPDQDMDIDNSISSSQIKPDPDEDDDWEVMATGESQDERWLTSYRREIRRQYREVLNDVHSKI